MREAITTLKSIVLKLLMRRLWGSWRWSEETGNLEDQIKDLLDQFEGGGCSICKLDRQKEDMVLRAQLELGQVRQEINRRIAGKEEKDNQDINEEKQLWISHRISTTITTVLWILSCKSSSTLELKPNVM